MPQHVAMCTANQPPWTQRRLTLGQRAQSHLLAPARVWHAWSKQAGRYVGNRKRRTRLIRRIHTSHVRQGSDEVAAATLLAGGATLCSKRRRLVYGLR